LSLSAVLAAQVAGVATLPGQSRDTQAQGAAATVGTGLIAGQVTLAGSGQGVEGVRVTLSGSELRGSRSILTDAEGRFLFVQLPEGTFNLRGTLTGHVSGTFGQKQPGRQGTPIALADGQQLKDASFEIAKGGVISGTVFDEKNRPSISTPVRVMRWTMQSGRRVLSTAGSGTTDDRGIYRIFNLMPGDYVVSAVPRNSSITNITAADVAAQARLAELSARGLATIEMEMVRRVETGAAGNVPVEGYAPVFYPGTTDMGGARSIRVGVSEEHLGIDFGLQRVPMTTVTGQVLAPPGVNVGSVQVRLMQPETVQLGIGQQTARPNSSGVFTFRSVVPGTYLLAATVSIATPNGPQVGGQVPRLQTPVPPRRLWAQSELFVDGSYAPTVTMTLQEGVSVSGHVTFVGSLPLPPPSQRIRVTMSAAGQPTQSMGLGSLSATVDAQGRFTLHGAVPGRYNVSANGATGWQVKSVMAGGVEVLDFQLEVTSDEPVPDVVVQFGDQNTGLTGVLTGPDGAPNADYAVVILPEDQRYWASSRRIRSTRPATNGKFGFVGLPPGDYRMAAVTDVDTAELTDAEFLRQLLPASIGVRLIAGQPVTQDIRVR
jgi:protocatechuate 3,4-dioxygenase beta subunit